MIKLIKQLLLAIGLAGAVTCANATPVDWTLNDFTLWGYNATTGDRLTGALTGSFTVDADAAVGSQVSNINVTFNGDDTYAVTSIDLGVGSVKFNFSSSNIGSMQYWRGTSLTNNGGDVRFDSFRYSQVNNNVYFKNGGEYLTGVPQTASAVPEPEAYAMMLVGLGLVGFAARRKQQA